MFRRGRRFNQIITTNSDHNEAPSQNNSSDDLIEATSSREWLDKHPLTEEVEKNKNCPFDNQKQNDNNLQMGRHTIRRSMWDLPY